MMRIKSHKLEERNEALGRSDYFAKPRIYFQGDGVFKFGSNFLKDNHVRAALQNAGIPSDTKTVWSRKAGCKCGCTPGFIVQLDWKDAVHMAQHFGRLPGHYPFDIVVELEQRS